jgi:hypothetical protein
MSAASPAFVPLFLSSLSGNGRACSGAAREAAIASSSDGFVAGAFQ